MNNDWQVQLELEFARAAQARAKDNEGQARVCARRAAGIIVREYLTRRGESITNPSAYELLQKLADDPTLTAGLHQSVIYLTMRVNEEFKLPANIDLVDEARKLYVGLLEKK